MGTIIYGSEIAKQIKEDIKQEVATLQSMHKRVPHLSVILVGEDVGSASYVRGKENDCCEVGYTQQTLRYDTQVSEATIIEQVLAWNADEGVDGILVQLPLPKHIDEKKVLFAIDPSKDVDGFHPYNIGKMMIQEKTFLPCTPKGVMHILKVMGYEDLSGMKAMVIGRSNIVGKPMAQLLLNANATVSITHSRTANIEHEVAQADIVVAAVGKAKMVKKDWLKKGAIVIDVGVNRSEDNKLCGDVDLEECLDHVKYITPVPKGVGPMTRAMLLVNTLDAYKEKE